MQVVVEPAGDDQGAAEVHFHLAHDVLQRRLALDVVDQLGECRGTLRRVVDRYLDVLDKLAQGDKVESVTITSKRNRPYRTRTLPRVK